MKTRLPTTSSPTASSVPPLLAAILTSAYMRAMEVRGRPRAQPGGRAGWHVRTSLGRGPLSPRHPGLLTKLPHSSCWLEKHVAWGQPSTGSRATSHICQSFPWVLDPSAARHLMFPQFVGSLFFSKAVWADLSVGGLLAELSHPLGMLRPPPSPPRPWPFSAWPRCTSTRQTLHRLPYCESRSIEPMTGLAAATSSSKIPRDHLVCQMGQLGPRDRE